MFNLARFGRTLGLTIGAAAGAAGVGALVALRRPLPRTTGTQCLPGLQARVRVLRDRWGVPHIYAAGNDDLFAALGYVHAQDRLWQMELNRRTGHGQLAEIFGPIALSSDRFARVLGFSRVARREVELLDEETRATIEAYLRGVNAFLAASSTRLPLEFSILRFQPHPWEIADVLVWSKIMALNLSVNWTAELLNARIVATVGPERARNLIPRYPEDGPITVPAGVSYSPTIGEGALRAAAEAAPFMNGAGGQGSNGWVVGGSRSVSGAPLLANDPHLGLGLPLVWYEAHLEGGDYSVAGVTLPGTPGIVLGHNARIAWGMTNAATDVQDLYIERFHPDDPLRYEWRGTWEQAELLREEIIVKGQAEPLIEEVRVTRHGPIIDSIAAPAESALAMQEASIENREPGNGTLPVSAEALALHWTALEPAGRVFRSLLNLNRARDWDEFRAAIADWSVPPQNFVYADVDGHYGYALGGDLPIRSESDGSLPLPGWNGAHEWNGYLPIAALPAAYDPPEGFVVTANNRIAGSAYRHHDDLCGEWANSYRAARIQDLLGMTLRHDPTSFARIQHDLYAQAGVNLARLMADVPLYDPTEKQARDLLVAWNGELSADSIGGTVYVALRYHLERRAYAELGALRGASARLGAFGEVPSNPYLGRAFPGILARIAAAEGPERHDPWLGEGRTWNSVVQESFALAVADLRRQLGNDPQTWRYGRSHRLTLRHPLGSIPALARIFNRGPWPTGGDVDTVWMGYTPRDTTAGPVYIGPSLRHIFDLSDWDNSRCILPSGQSGHPGSPHYADMNAAWRRGDYHPLLWSRARVEEHIVARLTLEPEG